MGREKHAEREQKLMIWSNMPATERDHYHLMMMSLLIVVVEYNLNCAGLNSAQIWPNAANVIGQQFKIPVGNVPRHTATKGFLKGSYISVSQSLNHNRAFVLVTETKVKAERPKDKQQLDSELQQGLKIILKLEFEFREQTRSERASAASFQYVEMLKHLQKRHWMDGSIFWSKTFNTYNLPVI